MPRFDYGVEESHRDLGVVSICPSRLKSWQPTAQLRHPSISEQLIALNRVPTSGIELKRPSFALDVGFESNKVYFLV